MFKTPAERAESLFFFLLIEFSVSLFSEAIIEAFQKSTYVGREKKLQKPT